MQKEKVLVVGTTSYLGRFMTKEMLSHGCETKIAVRNKHDFAFSACNLEMREAQVTKPESFKGICKDVDIFIGSLGITRQKDGLTYMDVDFRATANVIDEAQKS